MRRVFAGIVVLVALSAVAVVGCSAGLFPGTEGCVWRSVDEREYVRANEAVLRSIPLHPRLRRAYSTTWNHPMPAPNKCIQAENSPPYSAYVTTHVFVRSAEEPPLGFDVGVLGPEWQPWGSGLSNERSFRRGTALLRVSNGDEGFLLSVDHRKFE